MDALREGLGLHPRSARDFLDALVALARMLTWNDQRTFVDVGTAEGDLAVQIALTNPHLEGIGFDLPEVAPIFNDYVHHMACRLDSGLNLVIFSNRNYPNLMSF